MSPPPNLLLQKTPSVAFRDGSSITIQRVLQELERQAASRIQDGFSELNFTLGVMNSLLVTFVFAAFPEYLWLLYLFEAMIIFPLIIRFMVQSSPGRKIAYLLDYCWVMNIAGVLSLFFLFARRASVSNEFRFQIFLVAYGTACGPLLGATGLLSFVSLIFHHIHSMASVFIHFFPPLMFYILRWQSEKVMDAWPNTFHLDYDVVYFPVVVVGGGGNSTTSSSDGATVRTTFTGTVFGNTLIAYVCWFVPYFCWQWFVGLDLPSKRPTAAVLGRTKKEEISRQGAGAAGGSGNDDEDEDDDEEDTSTPAPATTMPYYYYDTVFHKNMRSGLCIKIGSLLWGRSLEESQQQVKSNQFEKRDFMVYMICHFMCALTSMLVLGYTCYVSKYIHGFYLVALLVICTWRGARRYTYYGTKMHVDILQKCFESELQHNPVVVVTAGDV